MILLYEHHQDFYCFFQRVSQSVIWKRLSHLYGVMRWISRRTDVISTEHNSETINTSVVMLIKRCWVIQHSDENAFQLQSQLRKCEPLSNLVYVSFLWDMSGPFNFKYLWNIQHSYFNRLQSCQSHKHTAEMLWISNRYCRCPSFYRHKVFISDARMNVSSVSLNKMKYTIHAASIECR